MKNKNPAIGKGPGPGQWAQDPGYTEDAAFRILDPGSKIPETDLKHIKMHIKQTNMHTLYQTHQKYASKTNDNA